MSTRISRCFMKSGHAGAHDFEPSSFASLPGECQATNGPAPAMPKPRYAVGPCERPAVVDIHIHIDSVDGAYQPHVTIERAGQPKNAARISGADTVEKAIEKAVAYLYMSSQLAGAVNG